ncbi:hypothetical protein C8Q76DRAFT_202860 [Earliella scabrosa]|nr:hypothetical protein C8Q76DRAFT_202860 [Earliella scabrosa]
MSEALQSPNSRRRLTREAKELRDDAFRDGRILTKAEEQELFKDIIAICPWYPEKTHYNYCRRKEQDAQLKAQVIDFVQTKLKETPIPTVIDIIAWSAQVNKPVDYVSPIVFSLLFVNEPAQL